MKSKDCFEMNVPQKGPFYDHFWPFFAIGMLICHKRNIQAVNLRCSTGLKSDWFKSYDTKLKYIHFCFLWFCTKTHICVSCIFAFCASWGPPVPGIPLWWRLLVYLEFEKLSCFPPYSHLSKSLNVPHKKFMLD